jgi:hypothetical protein
LATMEESERVRMLEGALERLLGLQQAAESRTGVVFATATGMLGVMAALLPNRSAWTNLAGFFTLAAAGLLVASLLFLSFCNFPRTKGPAGSLVFFGSIAGRPLEAYEAEVRALDSTGYLHDLTRQCHRNAEIALLKFAWVRRSLIALYLAVVPWLIAVSALYQLRP